MSTENSNDALEAILKLLSSLEQFSSELILGMIASALSCEIATYWKFDPSIQKLREGRSWYSADIHPGKLRSDSLKRTFQTDEGMPGKTWKFQKVFLTNDLQMDMCLPRSLEAHTAGLRSGFWLPIATGRRAFGVLELLRRDPITDFQGLTQILDKFAAEASQQLLS